ncbi:hypothetical protein [Nocardia altamirensis]|uniref:hypothetical protein n=1 Tax=Nocardia altamirensis TaxID=472158 RepID=UPI00083FE687|nr:hypothetical protein [Nocardia altamirensis]
MTATRAAASYPGHLNTQQPVLPRPVITACEQAMGEVGGAEIHQRPTEPSKPGCEETGRRERAS